ncbi:unnamed protein product [Prorocentrum cordatum]|uniref:Pentatricopeptide repeat-containing protein n=1 Tax=Prorocentrum cordatum TaxID=2364126 RepID=A0ABN9YD98_9DINO|nr:unnamed protein product [Polarella glacialis]
MWTSKLEPSVTFSYSASISACEKGEQWQRAMALLGEMLEAKLEPNVSPSQLQRWDKRVREGRTVAVGFGAARRDAGGDVAAQRHLSYMRWYQRVRKRRAVAAGSGAARRDVGGEV